MKNSTKRKKLKRKKKVQQSYVRVIDRNTIERKFQDARAELVSFFTKRY